MDIKTYIANNKSDVDMAENIAPGLPMDIHEIGTGMLKFVFFDTQFKAIEKFVLTTLKEDGYDCKQLRFRLSPITFNGKRANKTIVIAVPRAGSLVDGKQLTTADTTANAALLDSTFSPNQAYQFISVR